MTQITVVIPVFNKARFVNDCMASITGQGIQDVEIIIIDDASTDGSLAIMKEMEASDSRIRLLMNASNQGAALSRNQGIALARGEYILFVDADDTLAPGGLLALLDAARGEGCTPDLIRGVIREGDIHSSNPMPELLPHKLKGTLNPRTSPCLWIPWYHTSYLYRNDFLKQHSIDYPLLIEGEDPVFLAKALAAANTVIVTDIDLYVVRRGHEPYTRTTARHMSDCIQHIAMTRNIQRAWVPDAWIHGYRPHCRNTYIDHIATTGKKLKAEQPELYFELMTQLFTDLELLPFA